MITSASPKAFDSTLNKAIKLLRMYSNMKQGDLAKKLGLAGGYLSELEAGKKKITVDILNKYAKVFGVDASIILVFARKLESDKKLEKKIFIEIIKMIAEDKK